MILHGREIDVHVYDVEPFVNDEYVGFKLLWNGNIGWGEYTIYKHVGEDTWYADDEYMEDPKDDREFLNILFEDFTKKVQVE